MAPDETPLPWPPDAIVIRYLLGTLEEPDLSRIEQALIADAGLQERIAALEAELVDDYAANRLAADDRTRFERRYRSDVAHRGALEFSALLRRSLATRTSKDPPGLRERTRWSSVAAAVALIVLSLAGFGWWSARRDLAAARAALEATRAREPLPSPAPPRDSGEAARPSERAEVVVALTAGRDRAPASGVSVSIPLEAELLRLELRTPVTPGREYRAVVLTPDAGVVWRSDDLPVRLRGLASAVDLTVPVTRLARGDYVIRLSSRPPGGRWQDVADYSLRVAAVPSPH